MRATTAAAIVLLAFALLTVPALAEVPLRGTFDCGIWAKARNEQQAELLEYFVQGVLNGLAMAKDIDFWYGYGEISNDSVFLWMDNYCRQNPFDYIARALDELFFERTGF